MGTVAQWFLVVVFSGAALAKLEDRGSFLRALSTIPWVSVGLARRLSRLIPVVELAIAVLLVVAPRIGAVAAVAALLVFTAVVTSELVAGRRFSCGCFGGGATTPADWKTVARNGLLVAAGTAIVVLPGEAGLGAVLFGVACGAALVVAETAAQTLVGLRES